MKRILLLIVTLSLSISAYSQYVSGHSERALNFERSEFFQNGMRINMSEVIRITQVNDEANSLVRKAKTNKIVGDILGYPGYFAIGWGIGGVVAGGSVDWNWIGAGAGLIGLDFLFQNFYRKKAKLATEVFNANMSYTPSKKSTELSLGLQKNGFGLALNF